MLPQPPQPVARPRFHIGPIEEEEEEDANPRPLPPLPLQPPNPERLLFKEDIQYIGTADEVINDHVYDEIPEVKVTSL